MEEISKRVSQCSYKLVRIWKKRRKKMGRVDGKC